MKPLSGIGAACADATAHTLVFAPGVLMGIWRYVMLLLLFVYYLSNRLDVVDWGPRLGSNRDDSIKGH